MATLEVTGAGLQNGDAVPEEKNLSIDYQVGCIKFIFCYSSILPLQGMSVLPIVRKYPIYPEIRIFHNVKNVACL